MNKDFLDAFADLKKEKNLSEEEIIGAIKAKLDPRNIGTCPLVTRWKINVPIPAVKRAVAGSRPTRRGTRTVEPKATKRNCTPTIVLREAESS